MSGVLGIEVNKNCWSEMTDAIGIIQPRGDEWGGFAVIQGDEIIREADRGKITPFLEKEGLKLKDPKKIIAQVSQYNPQPARIEETKMGPIALAFDGKIANREELQRKSPYLVGSDVSIFARIIASADNPLEGLKKVYQNIKGPFSLVLLTMEGVFAARDILGVRPMIAGRFLEDERMGCAVASESASLEHIGMELIRDIRPGEIVSVGVNGFKTLEQIPSPGLKICSFEYGYWARPSSIMEDIWVGESRNVAGRKLAPFCPEADIISGFPMSGNSAAEGLHQASGILYQSVFDFNLSAGGRSFLPFKSEERAKRARNKLLIMPWAVKGKKIAMVDDSVVEGNQTLARIFIIKKAGAEEVHLMIETPLIKHPCPFDITRRGELIAATHSVDEIRKILGVKTLAFNGVEDFAEAIVSIQNAKRREESPIRIENLCLGCFTGECPQYPSF